MDCKEFIDTAETGFGPLSERQKEQFGLLDGLYRDWNSKINVISRKDMDGLYLHHVLHSLAIAGYMKSRLPEDYARSAGNHGHLSTGQVSDGTAAQADSPFSGGTAGQTDGAFSDGRAAQADGQDSAGRTSAPLRYLDLGTGGGFPGIPLAILFPDTHFHLVDSIGKKVRVATEVASAIGLENVTSSHARAEEIKTKYDFVVSRAVMPLPDLMKIVRKNISPTPHNALPNGLLCLKGGELGSEIAPFKKKAMEWNLSDYFEEEYFKTKKVVFVAV